MESETHDSKSGESPMVVSTTVKCTADLATNVHSYIIGSVLPLLHQILSKKASTDDLHKDNKTVSRTTSGIVINNQ